MAAAVSIARWLLSEASTGTGPLTSADDTGNGNTLTIDYNTDDLAWGDSGTGNGLEFVHNDHLAIASLDDIANNGNIGSSLDSATECSLILRADFIAGDSSGNRAFFIGASAGDGDVAVLVRTGDVIEVRFNEGVLGTSRSQYTFTYPTGLITLAIVIDSTEAIAADRVKLYLNGSTTPETPTVANVVLNTSLTAINSASQSACIGNRPNLTRGAYVDMYYAELFTGKLTTAQVAEAHTALAASNDEDWAATPPEAVTPAARTFNVADESRTTSIPFESGMVAVAGESRLTSIPAESRLTTIAAESRLTPIPAESRLIAVAH